MSTPSRIFRSDEFELPFITDPAGGFRVHAPLLAKQLGYSKTFNMVRALDDDEKALVRGASNLRTPADQDVWYVTEPGFYKIVGQRNINAIKDDAVRAAVYRFQRWVFHQVLPDMVRSGHATELRPGCTWSWDDVASQMRQRYGLDYTASAITMGLRSAGWLKAGSCTPKHSHRHKFWHTGTAYHLSPHVLPELVSSLLLTMRDIGDPQAQQYQLSFSPALKAIEGLS